MDAALGVLAAAGPASVACESRLAVLVAVAGFFPMSRSFAVCGSLSSAGRTHEGPQYSFPRKTIYHKFTTGYKTLWGRSTKCQGPARFPCNRMKGGHVLLCLLSQEGKLRTRTPGATSPKRPKTFWRGREKGLAEPLFCEPLKEREIAWVTRCCLCSLRRRAPALRARAGRCQRCRLRSTK